MGGGLGRVTNHPDYYLSDGSVSFLTGNILFRVHKSFFERESEVFRDLFANAEQDDPQSGSDARPFTLDVTPEEFEQFLWVWYDREYSYRQQPKENWVTIFRLAKRWAFNKIKELAVRELESLELPPAERISIYNEHGIEGERLLLSYVELCKSPTVPTEADARLLQMESLINVLQAREKAQRKAAELGHESPTSACLKDETLREIVSAKLFENLNPQSSGTSTGSGDQVSNRTPASTRTIIVGEPQVPNRNAQTANDPSHLNNATVNGKESREKEKRDRAESNNAQEKAKQVREGEGENKFAKATQDKIKSEEKKEKTKEKTEKEKVEKAKQDVRNKARNN